MLKALAAASSYTTWLQTQPNLTTCSNERLPKALYLLRKAQYPSALCFEGFLQFFDVEVESSSNELNVKTGYDTMPLKKTQSACSKACTDMQPCLGFLIFEIQALRAFWLIWRLPMDFCFANNRIISQRLLC